MTRTQVSKENLAESVKLTRDQVLRKGVIQVAVAAVVSYVVFTPAIAYAKPSVGHAFALGVPPMLIIAVSWMIGAWWGLGKDLKTFSTITIGMIPVRIAAYGAWVCLIHWYIPEVPVGVVVLSSIAHWIVFMIPEVIAFNGFLQVRPE